MIFHEYESSDFFFVKVEHWYVVYSTLRLVLIVIIQKDAKRSSVETKSESEVEFNAHKQAITFEDVAINILFAYNVCMSVENWVCSKEKIKKLEFVILVSEM